MVDGENRGISRHVKKVFIRNHDPLWQLQIGIIAVLILQGFTSDAFLPISKTAIIAIEAILLIGLIYVTSESYKRISRGRHKLAILLILIIASINIFSLIFLLKALIFNGYSAEGRELLLNGITIYGTNVLMFALLYWEIDGGGPEGRVNSLHKRDFIFPQMTNSNVSSSLWLPGFIDYLYLSVLHCTFTSDDAQPVSHKTKLLMMLQTIVSLLTVVLVLARAINVLH